MVSALKSFINTYSKPVPWHVPLERRYQTAAVTLWAGGMWWGMTLYYFLCSFPALWPLCIAYQIHMRTDNRLYYGGHMSKWFRNCAWFKHFCDYFPISLVKEADLDPQRNYVFGYHPHGVISMGAFGAFGTDHTGFPKLFPGITAHVLTLSVQFTFPFWRDLVMYTGCADVGKKSIAWILNKAPGRSVVIVIGGAAESLYARPKQADLTLKNRLGFVKVAMQNGADLVPVFGFGENDIYDQAPNGPGTRVRAFQKAMQAKVGFTMPAFHGRGVLNYSWGLIPRRHPIHVVFGKPIRMEKAYGKDIDIAEVRRYHQMYMDELKRIWDKYKDQWAKDRVKEIEFI